MKRKKKRKKEGDRRVSLPVAQEGRNLGFTLQTWVVMQLGTKARDFTQYLADAYVQDETRHIRDSLLEKQGCGDENCITLVQLQSKRD